MDGKQRDVDVYIFRKSILHESIVTLYGPVFILDSLWKCENGQQPANAWI